MLSEDNLSPRKNNPCYAHAAKDKTAFSFMLIILHSNVK